ncbi:MAG: branched-chain amino acid ABC transporter permease, partial [Ramlibacter sp.]
MDFSIASVLLLDGVTNGAIYALLGLATVLVFTVTRVIFIPQGEFVAYGALTLAILQTGKVPGTVWLLLILAAVAALLNALEEWRRNRKAQPAAMALLRTLAFPVVVALATAWAAPRQPHLAVQALLSMAVVTAYGPLVYRVAYQSLADASVLVLLIVSVGVHFAMTGLGLLFFGAEGFRIPSFWDLRLTLGPVNLTGQAIIIGAASLALIVGL